MGADCDIRFENAPDKVVYGGQQVAGIVDINAHNVVKVRKLTLYIEGIGECEWTESRRRRDSFDGDRHTEYTYYRGRDQYLNTVTHLIPNETEIQPGHHSYNFMFQVPPGAPSSVNEVYGRIYYKARVVFDRPWKTDLEFQSDFVVIRPLDLNSDPELRNPVQQEEFKNFCCWCCASASISFTVSMPQSGYVVGQSIPIKVVIDNPSTIEISNVQVKLVKHIEYTSQIPYTDNKFGETKVHKICHGSPIYRSKQEYDIEFPIPHTVPSTNNCLVTVINIHYELIVKAKTPGCHLNPEVTFPITIGTAPIGDQNDFYPGAPNALSTSTSISTGFSNCMAVPPSLAPNETNFSMPPLPPTNFQYPSAIVPSTTAQVNSEFVPTAPPNFQYPNVPVPLNDFSNNIVPPPAPTNFQYPPPVPTNNQISNNMMPPTGAPSAPFDPNVPPPSFEENSNKMLPPVNTDASAFHNIGQPMGFVIPSNNNNKT